MTEGLISRVLREYIDQETCEMIGFIMADLSREIKAYARKSRYLSEPDRKSIPIEVLLGDRFE